MRTILIAGAMSALALPCLAETGPLSISIKGSVGQELGSAVLTNSPRGVLLKLEVRDMPPGWHGLHFHEKGDCSSADFKSAGAHVHGPAAAVHGLLNPAANEAGDLPNLYVGADGAGHAEVFSPWTSLGTAAGRLDLSDADGSAIVIHASADDHVSQPIGGAGARLACGVIRPQ